MATINFAIPDAAVNRIRAAIGRVRNLLDAGGNLRLATSAEVDAELKNYLRYMVEDQEREVAREAIVVPDTGL